MKTGLFALTLLLLFAACKKDEHNSNNENGQITFTLNGVNHVYASIASYDTVTVVDTGGVQEKWMQFGGINGNNSIVLGVAQILSDPGTPGFSTGIFLPDGYDTTCPALHRNWYNIACFTYIIDCYDATLGGLSSSTLLDSTAYFSITMCDTSAHLISGTFSSLLGDGNGNFYQLSNGKFTNITYTNMVW